MHDFSEVSGAPAAVIDFLVAFDAQGEAQVPHVGHLVAEVFIDQSAIGEGMEFTVRMGPAQPQDIGLADQGLAAGHHEGMDAQGFALGDNLVHGLVGQIQGMTIFSGPAADAVHVAGTGGVEQDGPGNVAMVFLLAGLPGLQAVEPGFKAQVHDSFFQDVGIQGIEAPFHEVPPFATLLD